MDNHKKTKIIDRLDLGQLVTFIPNKKIPIYNWFYFKEGFSRDFVLMMLEKFKAKKDNFVLDPFLGSGTTLLGCKEKGINGVGIEINPLFLFVARAKLNDYDIGELKKWGIWLFSKKFQKPDLKNISPLIKKAFNKYNLEDIIFFRDHILQIEDKKVRDFYMLALMRTASKVTYAYKDGAVIKIIKKPTPPFKPFYRRIVKKMIRDIKKMKFDICNIITLLGDSRKLTKISEEDIDYVITSPPYLNKIEYTKVYEIEMEIFLKDKIVEPIRSYIGLIPRKRPKDIPNSIKERNLPPLAQYYFSDLWLVLKELYKVLKPGGRIAMVVAEGIFPDRIVETDIIISEMSNEIGFSTPYIWVVNKRVATKNRTVKIGIARESIVFMNK